MVTFETLITRCYFAEKINTQKNKFVFHGRKILGDMQKKKIIKHAGEIERHDRKGGKIIREIFLVKSRQVILFE